MGNNLKTIVLDFYGLPGCGKSTVSLELSKQLSSFGYLVSNDSYKLDHKKRAFWRKIYKFFLLVRFSLMHPIMIFRLLKLVIRNGHRKRDLLSQIIDIVLKREQIKSGMNNNIIILDQGIVQDAISLCIKTDLKTYYNGESYIDNYNSITDILGIQAIIIPVYLRVEENTALSRIITRNTCDSRIEKIDTIHRSMMMHTFFQGCEELCEYFRKSKENHFCVECDRKTPYLIASELSEQVTNLVVGKNSK